MKQTIIIESISILFAILFIYTGINKLIDYTVFKEQIATSPLLAPVSGLVALLLPWIEFLVAIALLISKWRLIGLYASTALMILFTCYITGILLFSEHLPCSCGGIIEELSWEEHIVMNIAFIILGGTGIFFSKRKNREDKLKLSRLAQPN